MSGAANSIASAINPQFHTGQLPFKPLDEKVAAYRHAVRLTDEAEISLTTAEGDRLTLSRSYESVQSLAYSSIVSDNGRQQALTQASLQIGSFSLSVEGDLNDEELADIKKLINDLSGIADHFYSGRLDTAVDQALKIGDTGTITEFSASFNYSATVAVTQMQQHPVPVFSAAAMESLPDPTELMEAQPELPNYAEMLQARWQQIWELLMAEEEKDEEPKAVADAPPPEPAPQPEAVAAEPAEVMAEPAPEPAPTPVRGLDEAPLVEAAQALFARTAATIAEHPRFTPFARPLVNHIIDRQANNHGNGPADPARHQLRHHLTREFSRIFDSWLVETT